MSENCSHDCSHCATECATRQNPQSLLAPPNELSSIKKVVAVVSGKGGVGKSTVTSLLAVLLNRRGYRVGILDADITGPSIPKAFGLTQRAVGTGAAILPVTSASGIDVMSINLLLENETDPVVWRGPVIAGTVKQFWTDVVWDDLDYLLIDMPPGTGDVPLTIFQSVPVDGIVLVTSPQQLVEMIVEKAVGMARMMDVSILGVVENYSYLSCPDCQKQIAVFGESRVDQTALENNLPVLARMPIDPDLARLCDEGRVEDARNDYLDQALSTIEAL